MNFTDLLKAQKEAFAKIPRKNDKVIPQATYVPFSDSSKIFALEGILNHASDVFGPYGGIYTELYTNNNKKEIILVKSRDGHRFFNSLDFVDTFVENVLCNVREKTLYVSGSKGKTSRDGTTSLALISSALSSDVLTNRLADGTKFRVPSFIVNATLEAISVEFRKLVDARKKLVYIPGEGYVEGGFDAVANAIATTVDRNMLFVNAYKKLMNECLENNIDITEASVLSMPERHTSETGNSEFNLKLDAGLRLSGSSFEQNKVYSLVEERAPIFFLDGFVGDQLNDVFKPMFKKWIATMLNTKDEFGAPLFSTHNPNGLKPPIFFYNRSTDGVKEVMEDLEKYVTIQIRMNDGTTVDEIIKPKFIFLQSEDISKESYNDVLDIFEESVINFNGIRRCVMDAARSQMTNEEREIQGNVPYTNQIKKTKAHFAMEENTILHPVENATLNTKINRYKYSTDKDENREDTIESIEVKDINLRDVTATVSFDGSIVYIKSDRKLNDDRIKYKRENIITNLKGYSINSAEYDAAKSLLGMYNTATITPQFFIKTEDEYGILYDVYQDAQGIFESVHVHGVLSGGNTTMFKVWERLRENSLASIKNAYDETPLLSEENKERYITFAEAILDSIFRAYYRIYKVLIKEDDKTVLEKIEQFSTTYKDDPTTSFDIGLGSYNEKVLESTRTTVDTFQAALDVLSDMLNIKRVRIQKESESITMTKDFVDGENVHISRDMVDFYDGLLEVK